MCLTCFLREYNEHGLQRRYCEHNHVKVHIFPVHPSELLFLPVNVRNLLNLHMA